MSRILLAMHGFSRGQTAGRIMTHGNDIRPASFDELQKETGR